MSVSSKDLSILFEHFEAYDHCITWDVVINDIPRLKEFCSPFLQQAETGYTE